MQTPSFSGYTFRLDELPNTHPTGGIYRDARKLVLALNTPINAK